MIARVPDRAQDFALTDPPVYARLLTALVALGIEVRTVTSDDRNVGVDQHLG